ncbi:MAG: 5-formyltetrahydrofolate cyclo-ligase [Bacteroidia bacterium]|jgi:5-formyltetrahydrofolate cyclo-ligase
MSDSETRKPLSKSELRQHLREQRRQLTADQQHRASQALTHSVEQLPAWQSASRVALYLAADGEIDLAGVAQLARLQGKALFLPVISEETLVFALWEAGGDLKPNRFGINEPTADAPRSQPSLLDIICLPLVAWDAAGGRLGMGGGYYDRALANERAGTLLGLGHEVQQVEKVPRDRWDVKLDYIATESALHDCST